MAPPRRRLPWPSSRYGGPITIPEQRLTRGRTASASDQPDEMAAARARIAELEAQQAEHERAETV